MVVSPLNWVEEVRLLPGWCPLQSVLTWSPTFFADCSDFNFQQKGWPPALLFVHMRACTSGWSFAEIIAC